MSTRITGKGNKLSQLLKKLYGDNSRLDTGVSTHIISGLEQNILLIYDEELTDDDVTILCRFLQHKLALELIHKIQINRTSDRKVLERRIDSALIAKNSKLLKEIYRFIKLASTLKSITFELVKLPKESFHLFGKALINSRSAFRWLGFRTCDIGGDEGLRILTPYLGKLSIQVLGIEQCGLTDISIPFIASILRAQQNSLDALYWNTTLRIDPAKRDTLYNASEIEQVYSNGLVALSIAGNDIQCKNDIYTLTRILRNNYWLLEELLTNTVIQSILLSGNPGYEPSIANIIYESIHENSKTSAINNLHNNDDNLYDTEEALISDLDKRHADGFRRIQTLKSPQIISLLNTWIDLQKNEVFYLKKSLSTPLLHDNNLEASFSSTIHSTTTSNNNNMRSKRYRNKTTSSLNASLDALLPLTIGYSILDFITEDLGLLQGGGSEQESPYKRHNPDKILSSSINGISGVVVGGIRTSNSNSFLRFQDFYQDHLDMYDDNDDDIYSNEGKDVLDFAIPNLSPSTSKQKTTSDYYHRSSNNIIDDNNDIVDDSNRDHNNASWESIADQWAESGGGDLLAHMNITDDQHSNSNNSGEKLLRDGRPHSRISLRPRPYNNDHNYAAATTAVTATSLTNFTTTAAAMETRNDRVRGRNNYSEHNIVTGRNNDTDIVIVVRNEQIYRKNRKQKRLAIKLKQQQQQQYDDHQNLSFSQPNYASLMNSSKSFTMKKRPFVAGSVSVDTVAHTKHSNNIQTPFEYSRSYSTSGGVIDYSISNRHVGGGTRGTGSMNKTPIETFISQRNKVMNKTSSRGASAAVKSLVKKNDFTLSPPNINNNNNNNSNSYYNTNNNLGIAQNNGTRIRARNVDRKTVSNLSAPKDENHYSTSSIMMKELSTTVLSATKNLEKVSKKLKVVADSLSSSIELNLTLQKDLSQSILHNNSFNTTSKIYLKNNDIINGDDDTLLSPVSRSASQRYDHSRSSPVSFQDNHILGDNNVEDDLDLELVDLIKLRMEEKLRTLLQS